ncbi:MAG: DUF3054 family protein, partial [Acidimicrobiales bacterium]
RSGAMRSGAMRWAAPAVDLGAVVVFVAVGRATHHHTDAVVGYLSTVWPFAAGLAAGWLAARWLAARWLAARLATSRRRPVAVLTGTVVCVTTVVVGMVLRVLAGQGTAAAFVVVSLAFLGAFMVGGRVLLARGARRHGAWSPP